MAERITITQEQFQKLQEQYPEPEFTLVKIEGLQPGDIVLRNPKEAEYHAFTSTIWAADGDAGAPVAYRNALVQQCVFPDGAIVQAWLKRYPGLASNKRVTKAINYLNGSADSLEGKG